MGKNKSKKAGAGLGLLLAGTLAMASLPMIGCGDDGKDEQRDQEYAIWNGIKFYQDTNVSDIEIQAIIDMFEVNLVAGISLTNFAAKIDKIYVTETAGELDHQGKDLYIGYDQTNWEVVAPYLAGQGLFTAQIKQKSNIMLANKELNHQNYLKHTAILPQMKKIEAERVKV